MGTLAHRLRATLATLLAATAYVSITSHCAHPKPSATPRQPSAHTTTHTEPNAKTQPGPVAIPPVVPPVEQQTVIEETQTFLFDTNVVRNVTAISEQVERNQYVFAKLGGSSVASLAYLHCFEGKHVNLGEYAHLQETIDYFRTQQIRKRTPFARHSLATKVGWSLRQGLAGRPAKVLHEIRALSPRYALAFFGGNDVQGKNPKLFGERLWHLAEELSERGVVPIIGAVFPRGQNEWAPWARRYNQISRGLAQGLSLPYIDFYKAARKLPVQGLASDGVHPNVYRDNGRPRACNFDDEGLTRGQNVRNLLTLQMLDKLRKSSEAPATESAEAEQDTDEHFVSTLPFAKEITSFSADSAGCELEEDERAFAFRMKLTEPRKLRMTLLERLNAKARILQKKNADTCLDAGATDSFELEPGTNEFVIAAKIEDDGSKVMLIVAPE